MTAEQSMANRLANEKSPYLLQHAHNPVDWYPWGKEALDKAKAENKPIFLSIGYSSCHWCHVMAKESFASEQLAHLLAENYVAIKVDKEERPDIDAIYMRACQVLTGQGGWPLTLILTPETEPFFAATYLPLESRYNLPGLLKLLEVISERWQNDREELLRNAADFAEFLRQPEEVPKATENWESLLKRGKNTLVRSFDTQYGGFGHFPKFPMPHNLLFLLEYHQWAGDEQSLSMVEKTLEQMYRGGIYDHVGYGFARYSTDEKWLAPHFEKMLYDNALLVMAYLKAYEITGRMLYKKVAEDTITYVFREMRDAAGGFYCAQDADSEGQEGRYYLLAVDEIMTLLGQEDGSYFIHHFAMSPKGNFEGSNIPNLIEADDVDRNDERINAILGTVYAYRLRRAKLHKDDKILTSWNGLMIAALARSYKTLGDERYKEAATQALHFINSRLQNPDGTLRVSYREGETRGLGFLEDYGFLLWAALEMYDACGEKAYLEEALHGAKLMRERFAAGTGGLYMTDVNSEKLLYRPIETYDGAIPSGNSVAAYALYRLAGLTAEPSVKEFALSQLQFVAGVCSEQPAEHCFALLAGLSSLTTK